MSETKQQTNFLKQGTSSPKILVNDPLDTCFNDLLENALFERKISEQDYSDSSPLSMNSSRSKQFLAYASKKSRFNGSLNESIQYSFKQASEKSDLQTMRMISPNPEKILDAPGLKDDYYLNLMDWGFNNQLAIALDRELYLMNYLTSVINVLPQGGRDQITSVSFMRTGNCLAVGYNDSSLELWDLEKYRPLRYLPGHSARVSSLSWSSHILSSGSKDTEIINHDVRCASNIIARLKGHSQEVCGLKWSLDYTCLASGSNDNSLIIWEPNMITPRIRFTNHKAAVKALAWCPWQKGLLASGGGTADKCIKFWNCDSEKLIKSHETDSQVSSLVWNRYEKEILSSHGFSKCQLSLWKYPKMNKIIELKGHSNRVLQMCESPEGEIVVSGGADECLRFWRVFKKTEKEEKNASNGELLKRNTANFR